MTEQSEQAASSSTTRHVLLILLAAAVLYCPGLFSPRDFWVEDEARYAEVIRETIADGHWLVPHLNGEFYPDKPPIYFWLCAGVSLVNGGITPFSCMAITWLSSAGALVATYFLGRRLLNARQALAGALAFASMSLALICSQIVRMDMLMTMFVVLALRSFLVAHQDRRSAPLYLFYVFIALAVLTKGPLGLVFGFLPAVTWLAMRREWRELGRLILHPGIAIPVALVGGWLATAWFLDPHGHDYVKNIFFRQIVARSAGSFSGSHAEPFYFYLGVLPLALLPWTIFVPRAVVRARSIIRLDSLIFLAHCFIVGFVIISAIKGKIIVYPLPLLPPIALIAGAFLADMWERRDNNSRAFLTEGLISSLLFFGVIGVLPFVLSSAYVISKAPEVAAFNFWPMAVVYLPLCAAGIVFSIMHWRRAMLVVLFAGMLVFSVLGFQVLVPQLDAMYSARPIAQEITRLADAGYEVGTLGMRRGILNFHSGRTLLELTKEQAADYFNVPQKRVLILSEKNFEKRKAEFGDGIVILSHVTLSQKPFVSITRQHSPRD